MKRVQCSAYFLAVTIRRHLKSQSERYRKACKTLDSCLYVEDLVTVVIDDYESTVMLYKESKLLISSAKINLCKWQINSNYLRK